jgi:hypothetical protein
MNNEVAYLFYTTPWYPGCSQSGNHVYRALRIGGAALAELEADGLIDTDPVTGLKQVNQKGLKNLARTGTTWRELERWRCGL